MILSAPRRALTCALFTTLALAACGSDRDPLDSATGMPTAGPPGGPGGDPPDDPTSTSSGTSETGGPGHGACAQYLACVAAVMPDALPDIEMTLGPDGTCWQSPPEVAQACVESCASGLTSLASLYPNEPACSSGAVDTTGEPTGTTGPTTSGGETTSTSDDPPVTTMTTSGGPCGDPPGQPNGGECTDPSGCGCLSGKCFLVPALGGRCSECLVDADCDGGGCSAANPIAGGSAMCNDGGPGDGCMSDAVCNDPTNDICGTVIEAPGLLTVSTCGECETDADCPAQTPVCAPTYNIGLFTGRFDCVAVGSVPDNGGCASDEACASGRCGVASVMGLFEFGVCGECNGDNDCGPGGQCDPATVNGNTLSGATCL
ncbi:hypothetical protein [Nannocystis pusilla]|uniref:Tryptophan synthase alpha chain n=1 Tax=Nannocystis pusilla TaxID=889268 RepID=A0ABS7TPN7_9BACT|nr:hypothetical protein [Nannocystis pusilla]MBZ5710141.1 hypothetical protein [Nannocystis pusilla]